MFLFIYYLRAIILKGLRFNLFNCKHAHIEFIYYIPSTIIIIFNSRQVVQVNFRSATHYISYQFKSQSSFDNCSYPSLPIITEITREEPTGDLIYLLTVILKQAQLNVTLDDATSGGGGGGDKKRKYPTATAARGIRSAAGGGNAATYYDKSVEALLEFVRADRETAYADLANSLTMAKALLKWLYFGNNNDVS